LPAFQNILIAVKASSDFSNFTAGSAAAFTQALSLAAADRSNILLMTVLETAEVETDALMESTENPLHPLEQVQKLHAEAAASAQARGVALRSKILHGNAEAELLRELSETNGDLLAIGTSEQAPLSTKIFADLAARLLRKASCPVWIARPEAFGEETPVVIAADDLGEFGEKVLPLAVNIAQLLDTRLLVLHATRDAPSKSPPTPNREASPSTEIEALVHQRLAKMDYRTIQQGTRIEVASGDAETALLEAVARHSASLLVMGTHGRDGLSGLLLGNSAERLMRRLPCSILAIKLDPSES
jgi:universal stress protein E